MRPSVAAPRLRGRAVIAAMAFVLFLTALAIAAVPATAAPDETFADDFSPVGFDGSDGTLAWATDWIETGESDGVGAGSIQVRNEPHCETDPCLTLGRSAGPTPTESALPDTFTWIVNNTNRPPVIVNPGPQTTPELALFSMVVTASDPDGTIPGLTDSGTLPAWAVLTDNLDGTATIVGTPGGGASGTTTVTITASDGALDDTAVFDITVTDTNHAPAIINPGDQLGAEGSPLSVVVTASDPDGTTVGFGDGDSLPAWATLTDNGDNTATISGTPGYTDAAVTTVTITASDGDLSDSAIFDIIIADTNRAPVVDPIADQSVAEGDPFALTVTASDPDGTVPSLVASGLPVWAGFVYNGDGTGTITGTPGYDDAGMSSVTVLADDGSSTGTASFDLTATNTNRAPALNPVADQSVAEGTALPPVTITAIDPDGTAVALAASGLPGWASFVDNGDSTGTITGTPGYNDAGVATVTVYGEDGDTPNLSDSISFDITVTNTNRAPVLAPIADQVVAETIPLTPVAISASDPDGTVPTLTATGLPGWATFVDNGDGSGTITGTPGAKDAAISTVTITASDGDLSDVETFDLQVTESNLPPAFDNSLPNRTNAEGDVVTIDAGATDPNGDNTSYTATGLPPGVTIDPAAGQISGTLPYDAAGTYAVQITAGDDGTPALSSVAGFTWTVTDTNRAPILLPIAAVLGPEMAEITFSAVATDRDGHDVTYSVAGAPPGAAIDPRTGVFTWTPEEVHGEGSYAVTVVATDSGASMRSDSKTVTITVTEVNRPPVVDPISDQGSVIGDSVDLQVVAADPDVPLNSIAYAASGLPSGLNIDEDTGAITGRIAGDAAEINNVTVTVTDDGSPAKSGTATFKWLVNGENRPPVMDPISDRTVAELSSLTIRPRVTDPDGDSITYQVAGAPPGASFDPATGTLRWTPREEQGPGTYRFSIIAADDGDPGLVALGVVTVNVTEVNSAPTIETPLDRSDDAAAAVLLQIVAEDSDIPANTLSFAATELPAGLEIDPATGFISGRIEATTEEVTSYAVTVTVSDGGEPALEAETTFTWTVVGQDVVPENFPPSVDPIAAQFSDAGATVELQVQASDTDPLTYLAEGLPAGLTIDPASGLVSGTVVAESIGTHAVVITIADGAEPPPRTAVSFTWTVTNREAADQKDDVVVAIVDIDPDPGGTGDSTDEAQSRPLQRGLVVMSTAAAATTESLRFPLALLLALVAGFAIIGRIGLYPLLWRGERHRGAISFYDKEIGFGLIKPDEGGEAVFVHAHAFPRRQRSVLAAGLRLRYRVLASDNRASAWGATVEGVNDG